MISLTRRSGVTSHTRERVHPTGHLGPLARNSPIGVVPPGRLDYQTQEKHWEYSCLVVEESDLVRLVRLRPRRIASVAVASILEHVCRVEEMRLLG